jgi:hypothetical protein
MAGVAHTLSMVATEPFLTAPLDPTKPLVYRERYRFRGVKINAPDRGILGSQLPDPFPRVVAQYV